MLEKIDPAVLRVKKTLEEVRLWAKVDQVKAQSWAEKIPAAFLRGKVTACKEIAANLKKNQPTKAWELLVKVLPPGLNFKEGWGEQKILSPLIVEMAILDREKTFAKGQEITDREIRDFYFNEAGQAWAREGSPPAIFYGLQAAREIVDSVLRLDLYQKIAETAVKKMSQGQEKIKSPAQAAIHLWGTGREKAKTEETEAAPFYEKALREIDKIQDLKERAYLLSALTGSWASLDEKRALRVYEKISSEFPETQFVTLMQIGKQLKKWNRQGAEEIWQKAFLASSRIKDPYLRAQRLGRLAKEWQTLDRNKGEEIIRNVEKEIRPHLIPMTKEEKILRANFLMANAEVLKKESIDENVKILEKLYQIAQREKNQRRLGAIAVAWSAYDPEKGMEIINQIEAKEVQVDALFQIARESLSFRKEETGRLLERAAKQALELDGSGEKIKALRGIADFWAKIDKKRAKAIYSQACQIAAKDLLPDPLIP